MSDARQQGESIRDWCIRTGDTRDVWLEKGAKKQVKSELNGKSFSLPKPYNKPDQRYKGRDGEKKHIQKPNIAYMRTVCQWLVQIDVLYLVGGYNTPGFPDSIGIYKGRFFMCEFKKPGGRLKSEQRAHLLTAQTSGNIALVVVTPDGFQRWVEGHAPVGYVETIPVY